MKINRTLSIAAATTFLATASANAETMINNLPEEGIVKVAGEVVAIEDSNEFTLGDATGTIEVESETDLKLSVGDNVIVTGEIDSDFFDTEIDASLVQNMDVISQRSDNTFIGANSYVVATETAPTYQKENYETQTKIENGNTVVKDVSYEIDAEVEAEIEKADDLHKNAKDGSLKEFDNKHAKDVDIEVDVEATRTQ